MEGIISWQRLCFLLTTIVCIQSTYFFLHAPLTLRHTPFSTAGATESSSTEGPASVNSTAVEIHENLSAARCEEQYPELYYEIDRAVKYWNNRRHTITPDDIDISWRNDAALRILIHENELRVLETKGILGNRGYCIRATSVLNQLQEALWSASVGGERLPTIEAAIVVDDISLLPAFLGDTRTVWTFASNNNDASHQRHWLLPDFGLYIAAGTGSFRDLRRRAMTFDKPFVDKILKVVWRGVRWTNEQIRGSLLDLTKDKPRADCREVDWETGENLMTQDEMCRFAFTVHTEGRSYSGRLPFLLNCNSLPLIHDLEWRTHFSHLLVNNGNGQNYVPVQRDFADLEDTIPWYLSHPEKAEMIIANSIATFRSKYLSPPATNCYLRRLISGWSQVSFQPNVTREETGGSAFRHRGVSFEDFINLDGDYEGDG